MLPALATGCFPRPACAPDDAKGCVITDLHIEQHHFEGKDGVSEGDVAERLATAESSWLVTPWTVDLLGTKGEIFLRYEHFDRMVLERDLERIVRYYETRGFYATRVRAARVQRDGDATVRVWISVDEGPPTILKKVSLRFADPTAPVPGDPPDVMLAVVRAKDELREGERFEEAPFEAAKRGIVRALTDRGYAYASVTGSAYVDRAKQAATATFVIDPGPRCTFGPIAIEGQGDLPVGPLRAVLDIEPGEWFSTDALQRAQAALGATGVLSSVSVEVVRSREGEPRRTAVPVRFLVRKAALRAIVVGGGAEVGSRVRAHLVTSWEHKNFLGGLRRLFIDGRAGVLFYPLQLTEWAVPAPGVRPLPEVRLTADLRQPQLFEERTTGTARVEARFFRPDTADVYGAPNTLLYENLELHGAVGVDRPFWKSRVRLGGSLNGQYVQPVPMWTLPDQPSALPEGFDWILIPYLEANAALDLRVGKDNLPDPINPRKGIYAAANVQAAAIFPEAGWDLRLRPEFRAYTSFGPATLALRLAGGFLFPVGYGRHLLDTGIACAPGDFSCSTNPCAAGDEQCNVERIRSLQITQLRGFYSGGLDTNRGYGRNGVNPQEEVLALLQGGTGGGITQRSPIGGRWLWEAQLEMRFPIYESFGGSVFADSGDAWYGPFAFRPHVSVGVGVRYATPIGPLRADVAVRIPCAQEAGTCDEREQAKGGPPRLFDQPINVSIAVGNPF